MPPNSTEVPPPLQNLLVSFQDLLTSSTDVPSEPVAQAVRATYLGPEPPSLVDRSTTYLGRYVVIDQSSVPVLALDDSGERAGGETEQNSGGRVAKQSQGLRTGRKIMAAVGRTLRRIASMGPPNKVGLADLLHTCGAGPAAVSRRRRGAMLPLEGSGV